MHWLVALKQWAVAPEPGNFLLQRGERANFLSVPTRCQKRHDLSNPASTLQLRLARWRLQMFWIAIFGFFLVWMLTKFGVLSATVGILAMVIKLLLIVAVAAAWFWLRKKNPGASAKQ